MTRRVTWRCEACGAKLTAQGLYEVGRLDRIHAASCPSQDAQKILAESRERHPSKRRDIEDVDVFEGWL